MQKKTKSRLVDFLVILVCLAGSALSVWQFWQELNRTLEKQNDQPIATITFKQNTAQRKFSDDFVWDRLRQNSPVYNGDTIRTAELSEATIYFTDGNIMDLSENTMARISLGNEGETAVDFSGGQISVQAAESGLTITSGSSTVDITKGGSVTASSVPSKNKKSGDEAADIFRVQVQSGSADLSTGSQSMSLSAGKAADMTGDGQVERRSLSVISPDPEAKIINFEEGSIPVDFQWDVEDSGVKLEFSDTKAFSSVREAYEYSGTDRASIMLSSGTHYWRISAGEETLDGKITIYASKAPSAIAPVPDYTAYYRTVKPSIRFIWSESERATTYSFEVADNERMENPVISQRVQQNSSIVTTLSEGKWYWRVTPYYTINNLGLTHPSDVNSFVIEKSGALVAPELLLPKSGSVVSTKVPGSSGAEAQNILFSWKDDIEASSYTVTITPDSPAYGSEIKTVVNTNYFSLDTATHQVGNGSWKWSVEMTDVEGNSVKSGVIPFLAMDSEISQKPLFPGNDYCLSVSRVPDTNFVWRSNLSSEMEVQFASDPAFKNIITSFKTKNTSASGLDLPEGDCYWRIVTQNDVGTFISDPVHFEVEGILPAPECVIPENESRFVVEDEKVIGFAWKPVETADYYQFRIYGSEDLSDIVYENTYIEDDGREEYSERVSFAGKEEKTYYWSVQAYREESDDKSRAVSLLGKYSFFMRVLKPITLLSPGNAERLEGLDVVMNPPAIEWNSIDELSQSELFIYKDSVSEDNVVAVLDNPEMSITMPRLYEGSYFWTVRGITWDDLDASSKQTRNFYVTKIPPMDAPVVKAPSLSDVYSTAYFEDTTNISFSWDPVLYATKYVFTLFDKDGKTLRSAEIASPNTSYTVNFKDILYDGAYSWTVEARTIFDDGVVRYGNKAESDFVVSLPKMNAPVKNPVGNGNLLDEKLYHLDKEIRFSWLPVAYADEYLFTLKNSEGRVLAEKTISSIKANPSSRLGTPDNFYEYTDIETLYPGDYKWTVEARNYINGKLMQGGRVTEDTFSIRVNDMEAPVKIRPFINEVYGSALYAADSGLRFSWRPVDFADEYVLRFYDSEDNLIEEATTSEIEYIHDDLDSLVEGKYSWSVEARCYLGETILQNGKVSKDTFELYLPDLAAPVKTSPEQGHIVGAEFFIGEKDLVFSWESIPYANEYILTIRKPDGEVLKEVSFTGESELTYTVPAVELLEQGLYTWDVEACFHYHGRLLQHGVKEESSFSVTILDLDAPEIVNPAPETVLNIDFFENDKPQLFEWKSVPLAADYLFTLYSPDGAIAEQCVVTETSLSLEPVNFVSSGEYTWTVEARSYYRGDILQHGIEARTSLITDVTKPDTPVAVLPVGELAYDSSYFKSQVTQDFSWESVPLADAYIFRIEKDDASIVFQDITPADTLTYTLETEKYSYEGKYFWTVEPIIYYRDIILQTGDRARTPFDVVMPPLDIPSDKLPAENKVFGVELFKADGAVDFSWHTVKTADCYSFLVKDTLGNIIDETIIPSDIADSSEIIHYSVDASNFVTEGIYVWSVEARVMYNGRIIQTSGMSESPFEVSLPNSAAPVIVPDASLQVDYDYLDMNDNLILEWEPVEFADEYQLQVFGLDDSLQKELTVSSFYGNRAEIPLPMFFTEGTYRWTLKAVINYADKPFVYSDISEGFITTFFPELSSPVVLTPENEEVLDTSYFRENREIVFSWEPVQYASAYRFNFYGEDGRLIDSRSLASPDTEVHFSDLTSLAPGLFRWTLEPIYEKDGYVLEEGNIIENEFSINLPTLKAPSVGNTGSLYGN